MTDQAPLLFTTDLEKFLKIAITDNPDARLEALRENINDLILCEIVRYGIYNDRAMIEPLAKLYEEVVLPRFPDDHRFQLFRHIKGLVDNVDFVSMNALLPFIIKETKPGIVSSAVIDYVSIGPLTDGDPMSRPKDIVALINDDMIANIGAAFGGLLHLGDPRVCKLIWPLRDLLEHDAVRTAVNCTTGFLHAASVEFEVDWLEEMEGDDLDGLFGLVASGLVRQLRSNQLDVVFTGQRQFPFPKREPTPAEQERNRAQAKPLPLQEYVKRIAPRLYALERTEPPPRIMPAVLTAWGLTPATDPSEAAQIDDRHPPIEGASEVVTEQRPDDDFMEVREEWFDGEGSIFLSWGILNPDGPTLYCLGERLFQGQRRYFLRWLHMLGGATYYGKVIEGDQITYNDIFDAAVAISRQLAAKEQPTPFNVIPSFVIPNHGDTTIASIARDLISGDAPSSKDWGREVAYLDAFGEDFFGRAGCEIRVAYDAMKAMPDLSSSERDFLKFTGARYGHIPAFKDAKPPTFISSPYTAELFDRWWATINKTPRMVAAIQTLVAMWRGAQSTLSEDMVSKSVSIESVISFLTAYRLSVPE